MHLQKKHLILALLFISFLTQLLYYFLSLDNEGLQLPDAEAFRLADPKTGVSIQQVSAEKALEMQEDKGAILVDVRELYPNQRNEVIPGARLIPTDQIELHLKDLPRGRSVVAYCS